MTGKNWQSHLKKTPGILKAAKTLTNPESSCGTFPVLIGNCNSSIQFVLYWVFPKINK